MLETIRESSSLKAPLPPRSRKLPDGKDAERYKGDQDPTDDTEGLEYAKAYHSLQLKSLNTQKKAAQPATSKGTETSPDSATSDQFLVCNTLSAFEPLYGDPGEEDYWK